MGAFFPHPEKLINVNMEMNALNPWELHNFKYPHFAIPDPMTCIIGYELSGDVPKGISVDSSGTISGKIKHFGEQPSCQDNFPNETRKLDGSNWKNDGRFRHPYYDFEFTITVHWKEKKDTPNGPIPCVIPGTTKQKCIIRLVKDHNIDHKIYRDKYMSTPPENVNGNLIEFTQGDNANPGPLQPI